ncbi:MAG: hypothetical protein JXX29_07285 [Deltaproteobacteria bacterium]|nr:hypothetical protein [Deltaproteobacteria bacterium]MBN2671458.1 hypothetical protein [Deltaproteobacteria bacterium]
MNKKISEIDTAYRRGDFSTARKQSAALLDESTDTPLNEKQKIKVQQIKRAVDTDPIAAVAFGVTLFVLIFISMKYLL